MFKQSRIKIIASVMAALLLFLMIAIAVIYGSSYVQIQKENKELLVQFGERFSLADRSMPQEGAPPEFQNGRPMEGVLAPPDDRGDHGDFRDGRGRAFDASTFYYVALSSSGEVLASDTGNSDLLTEDYLIGIAEEVSASPGTTGQTDGMTYSVTDKGDYILVAFMDNAVIRGNMWTLLKTTLIAFGISVIAVFILSLYLSKRIISPLEDNDKRQKQFVSDAGHELKTPISVMSTNCELLEREIGDNQWLSNIRYENERMSMLVKELLDLSHAENGVLQEETVDLSDLVTGETLPFESIAFEKGLMLDTSIEERIVTLGNPTQLKQLTAILLDNAISHSEGGKDIWLSLSRERKHAVLKVTNYGQEIPSEKKEMLFERFYRVDEARTGDDNHYGLGLAIARAITQAHGGSISVVCEDGKITFTAEIPLRK